MTSGARRNEIHPVRVRLGARPTRVDGVPLHRGPEVAEWRDGAAAVLTFLVGGEEDAEAALAAGLVRPHADDPQRGGQHDVVGHRRAELVLQVLHRAEGLSI